MKASSQGQYDCHLEVMAQHLESDLSFLDEQVEFEGNPSPKCKKGTVPIFVPKPPFIEAMVMPSEAAPIIANLQKNVRD